MDISSNHKAIITKLRINWKFCDKDCLSKFLFKNLNKKVFQTTLLTKLDLIKTCLKNKKTA